MHWVMLLMRLCSFESFYIASFLSYDELCCQFMVYCLKLCTVHLMLLNLIPWWLMLYVETFIFLWYFLFIVVWLDIELDHFTLYVADIGPVVFIALSTKFILVELDQFIVFMWTSLFCFDPVHVYVICSICIFTWVGVAPDHYSYIWIFGRGLF